MLPKLYPFCSPPTSLLRRSTPVHAPRANFSLRPTKAVGLSSTGSTTGPKFLGRGDCPTTALTRTSQFLETLFAIALRSSDCCCCAYIISVQATLDPTLAVWKGLSSLFAEMPRGPTNLVDQLTLSGLVHLLLPSCRSSFWCCSPCVLCTDCAKRTDDVARTVRGAAGAGAGPAPLMLQLRETRPVGPRKRPSSR